MDPGTATIASLATAAVAAMIWLLKHTFSVTLPKMAADFESSRSLERKEFLASLTESRVQSLEALREGRTQFLAEMAIQREECNREHERWERRWDELSAAVRKDQK